VTLLGRLHRALGWLALLAACGATATLWLAVDRIWWLLPLGYGPRWPWLGLVALAILSGGGWARRLLFTAATAGVVAWGLLGLRLPSVARADGEGGTLRLVVLNAAVREAAVEGALDLARSWDADVVVVVECPRALRDRQLAGYRAAAAREVCTWSRMAGTPAVVLAPSDPSRIGWSGTIAVLNHLGGTLPDIGVVHLRSVRNELSRFLDLSELPAQADSMAARHAKRIEGSRYASRWFLERRPPPALVVGDFNLVVESPRFRSDWGRWHDAFDRRGFGTGYTWHSRWYGLRIDHVLHDDRWATRAFTVGPDVGSDHRPLLVELVPRADGRRISE
jgi:endonuclease/exonuclease/phosphatase (EEP) superfamily protein YafD